MRDSKLPHPVLEARAFGTLRMLTDDALARERGVRVAFSGRAGGVSRGAYRGLNLADHVGDDPAAVRANRSLLMCSLDADGMPLVVPKQVHGDVLVEVRGASPASVESACDAARRGADGIVVAAPNVAALLCFADCVPVVIVAPSGEFAVVHAGWRGVIARIASKAARRLAERNAPSFASAAEAAASLNVYLGPHIHAECFECAPDLVARFEEAFGAGCIPDGSHVDLARALRADLSSAGVSVDRIVCAEACTACEVGEYYSYRAEGGVCGRQAALAFRKVT